MILDKPIDLGEYEVPQETAFDTYNSILDTVGASIPKRDAIDAKVTVSYTHLTLPTKA